MHTINLEWKPFQIYSKLAVDKMKLVCSKIESFSENNNLQLHLSEKPSEQEMSDINDIWDNISDQSEEATSFVSTQDRLALMQTKKEAALAKLQSLGLTVEDLKALGL